MNTFELRYAESRKCAASCCSYLLSRSDHGIRLGDQPALQYLYYIDQIGIAVSPIQTTFFFSVSPTVRFSILQTRSQRLTLHGRSVAAVSDDPLLEEYAVARQVWNLSVP